MTWLRYTVWIILYPLGLSTEATVIYKSIPYLEDSGRFKVALPNALNFTFSLTAILRIYLLFLFIPTAYLLISHMYHARIKKLGKTNLKTS